MHFSQPYSTHIMEFYPPRVYWKIFCSFYCSLLPHESEFIMMSWHSWPFFLHQQFFLQFHAFLCCFCSLWWFLAAVVVSAMLQNIIPRKPRRWIIVEFISVSLKMNFLFFVIVDERDDDELWWGGWKSDEKFN